MSKTKRDLESKIETYFKQQIKSIGALAYKFKSTVNGVPDQVVIYDGRIHFVEVKRPDEVPRANQVHIHSKINAQGVPVHVIDTNEQTDSFIKDVLGVETVADDKEDSAVVIRSKNAFKMGR